MNVNQEIKIKHNFRRLIDRIENTRHGESHFTPCDDNYFCMDSVYFGCGSPACIAGHIVSLQGDDVVRAGNDHEYGRGDLVRRMADFLSVDYREANRIYRGGFSHEEPAFITPEHAADYLYELRDATLQRGQ